MAMVTRDDDSQNIYTIPVGKWNKKTSDDKYKYKKHQNAWIGPGESITKKETIKIYENKTMRL